ncbi:DUF3347 domain-containing protein [uncultured Imperialibacter sp.]|tara:strand:- start:5985 stop:6470 length:486 start_codon:yes stop_codon:yes gene_type:complete
MKAMLFLLGAALSVGSLSAQSGSMNQMLNDYLVVKEALVKGDVKQASTGAGQLVATITTVDLATLSETDKKAFSAVSAELLKQAQVIAGAKEVEKQRAGLAALSQQLWPLVKGSDAIGRTVFYDYCPMKQSYWLSAEVAIRNPFYGSQMLGCGKVDDKINE